VILTLVVAGSFISSRALGDDIPQFSCAQKIVDAMKELQQ
jgi:hypothetical protein